MQTIIATKIKGKYYYNVEYKNPLDKQIYQNDKAQSFESTLALFKKYYSNDQSHKKD